MASHDAQCAELDLVGISQGPSRIAHGLACWDAQGCAGHPAELGRPGDIVVVDVRLHHVAQAGATSGEQLEDPVDIPLRIHDNGLAALHDRVAPITQLWGLDGEDLRGHGWNDPTCIGE